MQKFQALRYKNILWLYHCIAEYNNFRGVSVYQEVIVFVTRLRKAGFKTIKDLTGIQGDFVSCLTNEVRKKLGNVYTRRPNTCRTSRFLFKRYPSTEKLLQGLIWGHVIKALLHIHVYM